ncbi:MAG TPA: hypothetical protein DCS30_16225 [Rhizobiales bacterium]|nr:hypothetical protein [Hyphomicrobiales bacterium]
MDQIMIDYVLSLTARLLLLFCFLAPSLANAAGLPKAENGYQYYCAGVKADDYLGQPNGFIVFKLREKDVRNEKKALVLCKAQVIDERFVLKRFLEPNDPMIKGHVNFKLLMEINGERHQVELTTGGSGSYLSDRNKNIFESKKESCGAEEQPDENGLIRIKRPKKTSCTIARFKAFGSVEGSESEFEVGCYRKRFCLFSFFYRDWRYRIRSVPDKWVPHWREIHKQAIKAIDERLAFYIAPNQCAGPLHCSDIARILNIPQK